MMCYENGGTVDDLLVYKMGENDFFLVINASNIDKDWAWMLQHAEGFDIDLQNRSEEYGQIAVQGPESEQVMEKVLGIPVELWMNLQDQYNIDMANITSREKRKETVRVTIPVSDRNLLRELAHKFGWACML